MEYTSFSARELNKNGFLTFRESLSTSGTAFCSQYKVVSVIEPTGIQCLRTRDFVCRMFQHLSVHMSRISFLQILMHPVMKSEFKKNPV